MNRIDAIMKETKSSTADLNFLMEIVEDENSEETKFMDRKKHLDLRLLLWSQIIFEAKKNSQEEVQS